MTIYEDDCMCTCGHFAGQHDATSGCAGMYEPCACRGFAIDWRASYSNWAAEDATW